MQGEKAAPVPYVRPVSLDRVRAARSVGRGVEPGSLNEAVQVYKASSAWRELRPKTRQGYQTAITLALGHLPQRFEPHDVEDWLDWLVRSRGLSPATANSYRRCLAAVLKDASRRTHDHRLIDAVELAKPRKEAPRKRRTPPPDAYARALPACRDRSEILFLRLVTVVCLRKSEVLGLLPEDLSHDGVLRVERQRRNGDTGPRKNKTTHFARLDPETTALFRWAVAHHHELRSKTGWHKGHVSGHVLPWGETRLEGFLARVRQAYGADVERYMPAGDAWHTLRHLGASTVYRTTGDLAAAMRALGDNSMAVAMTYVEEFKGIAPADGASGVAREMERARQVALPSEAGRQRTGAGGGGNPDATDAAAFSGSTRDAVAPDQLLLPPDDNNPSLAHETTSGHRSDRIRAVSVCSVPSQNTGDSQNEPV